MARDGGIGCYGSLRSTRLVPPFPSRKLEVYGGPPTAEDEFLAKITALDLPSEEYLQDFQKNNDERLLFLVDCTFDPYSEEWLTISVDPHIVYSRGSLESINKGPMIFMNRVSISDREGKKRTWIPYRRSKMAASTAVSPDGNLIAWPGYTHFCVFNRFENKRKIVHSYFEILSGTFSPDGKHLALLSGDNNRLYLRIVDSYTFKIVAAGFGSPELFYKQGPLSGFRKGPVHLVWSKCGRFLGMSTYRKELVVFKVQIMIDYRTVVGIPIPTLQNHPDLRNIAHPKAYDFAISKFGGEPEVTALALGTVQNSILLYEVNDIGLHCLINECDVICKKESMIRCLRFSNAQDILAVGLADGFIHILDTESLLPVKTLRTNIRVQQLPKTKFFCHGFSSLSFTCSDNFLAAGSTDGRVRVWCVRRPIGPLIALCRTVIRSHCKIEDMSQLPLSHDLFLYLTDPTF